MKKTITIYGCDICGKEGSETADFQMIRIPLIWTSEQTEGTTCKPYVETGTLLACHSCIDKIASAINVFAYGAQGYNHFEFREPEKFVDIKWCQER